MTNNAENKNTTDLHAAMNTWGDMVLRLALCRTQQRSDAEDVFQMVFLKLYKHTSLFREKDHLKAWLLRTTINCCNDLAKNVWNTRRTSLDHIAEPFAQEEKDIPDILAAIDHLPDKQRTTLHLYYYEGYSTDEIALITEENAATVRSHLFRARKALKITLGGNDERVRVL